MREYELEKIKSLNKSTRMNKIVSGLWAAATFFNGAEVVSDVLNETESPDLLNIGLVALNAGLAVTYNRFARRNQRDIEDIVSRSMPVVPN